MNLMKKYKFIPKSKICRNKRGISSNLVMEAIVRIGPAILIVFVIALAVGKVRPSFADEKEEEIKAMIETINTFLEIQDPDDPGKKARDVVIESYSTNDFTKVDRISKEHFAENSDDIGILIADKDGIVLYDSFKSGNDKLGRILIQQSEKNFVELQVPESGNDEVIRIMLQIRE